MIKKLVKMVMCHLIGDYVLQTDYISSRKGKDWYHMFVHCGLYCVPFALAFGINWKLAVLFISHIIVDPLKAMYQKLNYMQDQVIHYLVGLIYVFF